MLAPEYFAGRPEARGRLADYASSRDVVAMVQGLGRSGEGALNLRDVQYFHEPSTRDTDGLWHRDGDNPAGNDEPSTRSTVLRFRVAFAPDDHLEYVPGSHARRSTAAELGVLRGPARSGALPSPSTRVELDTGDVCVFNVWGIHRARYRAGRVRRTLDLTFGFGPRKSVVFADLRALTGP